MTLSWKPVFAAMVMLAASVLPAAAAGVCNCCGPSIEEMCKGACADINVEGQACRPAPWFGDASMIGGEKPLNGFSYKGLNLDDATRQELEAIRVWVERERRAAEDRARKVRRDVRRGRAGKDEFDAAEAERLEAVVNYQHTVQAYIAALRK